MSVSSPVSIDAVNEALDGVIDPCSIGVGVPMGMREMGLVKHVGVSPDGVVDVVLRMTTPGCHMGALVFEPAILEKVGELPGVTEVRIEFLEAIGWTEDDIEPHKHKQLVELRLSRPSR